MRPIDAQELKSRITVKMTIELMEHFGAYPIKEDDSCIIFPAICHSSDSPKLYYYPSTNSFNCWSQCTNVDHISIVQEQEGLNFKEAMDWLIDFFNLGLNKKFGREKKEIFKPKEIIKKPIDITEKLPMYNKSILNTFIDYQAVEWINEGISEEIMKMFGIKFDIDSNAIVIPHYDMDNRLIGIRVRNLDKDIAEEYGKYLPLRDKTSGISYAHQITRNLYGLYLNKENIMRYKKVILVESEKSVLKIQGFYPNDNISLALCGSNVSDFQLELLKSIGVEQVIYAFDKEEDEKMIKKLNKIYKKTALLFDVYTVEDKEGLLELKDSPCDKGKEVFDILMRNKEKYNLEL